MTVVVIEGWLNYHPASPLRRSSLWEVAYGKAVAWCSPNMMASLGSEMLLLLLQSDRQAVTVLQCARLARQHSGSRAALRIEGSTPDRGQHSGSRAALRIQGSTPDPGQHSGPRAALRIEGSTPHRGQHSASRAALRIEGSTPHRGQHSASRTAVQQSYQSIRPQCSSDGGTGRSGHPFDDLTSRSGILEAV